MIFNCPGAQKFRQPQPQITKCPSCNKEMEVWTDEIQTTCPDCKTVVMRQQKGQSCLDWCRYAKECVGNDIYSKYLTNKSITLREKLIKELEDYFGNDFKRIKHAKNVMHFAEELLRLHQADWHIVIPASILHDVGIKVSEEKYGLSDSVHQEKEGPIIASKILLKLGLKKEDVQEICEIIAHHHSPSKINTHNFKVLYDADLLVNLKDEADTKDKIKLKEIIEKGVLTDAAKALATKIYL